MAAQNPVFNEKTLKKLAMEGALEDTSKMTVNGSINKTGILLVLMTLTGAIGWNLADSGIGAMLALVSALVNLALCFVIVFNREKSPILAPIYALIEGFAIGAISAWSSREYPGIVSNAMLLTISVIAIMLGLYTSRVIVVTQKTVAVIVAATLGICVTYLIDLALGFAGIQVPFIHSSGPYGILFSAAVVVVAAMNLLVDFAMIERSVQAKAPKYMEWYAGFAVLVTIVWLYIEILRLLSKLNKR